MFVASENAADLTALRELIEAGKVVPAVDRTYPLGEVAAGSGGQDVVLRSWWAE